MFSERSRYRQEDILFQGESELSGEESSSTASVRGGKIPFPVVVPGNWLHCHRAAVQSPTPMAVGELIRQVRKHPAPLVTLWRVGLFVGSWTLDVRRWTFVASLLRRSDRLFNRRLANH